MYKKIIAIIILSFFFVLSCSKENPNNPNNPGDVSGGGGDTGGSTGGGGNTGDGGDGGQTQPSLSKYAGAWKQDFRIHVFGENYYIRKMGRSDGRQEAVFITDIQYSSADNGFKVYYKNIEKELDAVISFSSETSGNIKVKKEKNYMGTLQNINYNITKLPKGKGIDSKYAGTYKCTNEGGGTHRSIKIDADGSIESFYDNISEFKIPAEQITKNSEGVYGNYLYKTTYDAKDAVLEIITLKFDSSDSSHCTFRFEGWFTSGSPLSKGNGSLVDYIKQ